MCVIFPFHGFVPCMFCLVLKIFTHPFFHVLYKTDKAILNSDTVNACNKELWGKGVGTCYAVCLKNLFCVAIIEVLTRLAVHV